MEPQTRERIINTANCVHAALQELKRQWFKELEAERLRRSNSPDHHGPHNQEAVVSEYQLLEILCQADSRDCDVELALDSALSAFSEDLSTILRRARRSPDPGQDHLPTIFRHDRFIQWMGSRHPDLILLDTDARSRDPSRRDLVSATSLLCTSFVLGMKKMEPNQVYVHFLCGLHRRPDDPWAGLSGLLRFLIAQLLLALRERNILNLDLIADLSSHKTIVQLECAATAALCSLLHQFVRAFPPGITVYCIIDGISLLEASDGGDSCTELVTCLQSIVQDDGLCPSFKVMLTEASRPAPSTSWLTPLLQGNHIRLRSNRATDRHQGNRRRAPADFARLAAPAARDRRSRSPWDRRQPQHGSGYAYSSGNWGKEDEEGEEESDEDELDLDVSALLARV